MIINVVNHIKQHKLIPENMFNSVKGYIFENLCSDDKFYNLNLSKKIHYFMFNLCDFIFSLKCLDDKKKVYEDIYSNLLTKGAHYLRLDSLQVIRECLDYKKFEYITYDQLDSN